MTRIKPIRRAPYYLHHPSVHPRAAPKVRTPAEELEADIALADPSVGVMRDLLVRLQLSNDAREMLTFNKVTKDWEPWF